MPPENTHVNILQGYLYTSDGKCLMPVTDTPLTETFAEEEPKKKIHYFSQSETASMTFRFKVESRKTLNRVVFGWSAKGPIRKRVLMRLWKEWRAK